MENQIINTSNERVTQLVSVMNQESLDVIKGLVAAQQLTDAEFKQFIVQCKRTGLDPVTRQIYAIKSQGRMAVMTSIDGFRLIAERSGNYAGQDGPYWCGEDGQWVDIWLKPTPPAAAKVGVMRKGFDKPLYAVAVFNEYAKRLAFDNQKTGAKKGDLEFMWAKMPALMIAKVAESLALRKAFPNDMSGIYTADEMDQAETPEPRAPQVQLATPILEAKPIARPVPAQQVTPEAAFAEASQASPQIDDDWGSNLGPAIKPTVPAMGDAWEAPETEYVVTFGKHKGKRISEIAPNDLISYIAFLKGKAAEENKQITGQVAAFIFAAENLLGGIK